MKKIIFGLFALIMGLFTSCSNDDIEIIKSNPRHKVILNVSTQNTYDDFGIADEIRTKFLREGTHVIGINTFLYNAAGKLVASKFDHVNNYNNVSQVFEAVEEGDYTLVSVEMLVVPDKDYKSNYFEIADEDDISTIKLKQTYNRTGPVSVVGVYTDNISVASDMSINAAPKAIGSMLHVHPKNYENSPFAKWGIATNDALDYYSLNPNLTRESKFYEDVTKKGYINVRLRADTDNSSDYYWSVYVLEAKMEWKPVAQTEDQAVEDKKYKTWKSNPATLEDGQIYTVGCYYLYSDTESDYVASYLGDDDGLAQWEKEWDTYLQNMGGSTPGGNTFVEPYTDWKIGTVSAVKSFMTGMELVQDISLQEDGTYSMVYFDINNNNVMYQYDFANATSGMSKVFLYFDTSAFTWSNITSTLEKQGYSFVEAQEELSIYANSTTVVGAMLIGDVIVLLYMENASGSSVKKCSELIKKETPRMPRAVKSNIRQSTVSLGVQAPWNMKEIPTTVENKAKFVK